MLNSAFSAESNSNYLLQPLANGLSEQEEIEFQKLSGSLGLNSKELHRFRLLRTKRWRPDTEAQEQLNQMAPEMNGLLSELLKNHADIADSHDWKYFVQKVRDCISKNRPLKENAN
jgi:hypothetical protein